jgi:hypothetical protein
VCSGKEHLNENHLHRSQKLPKRKKEMKKTIAILLVMTIALAGVFAAETSTSIFVTTSVAGKNLIKVTATNATIDTYELLRDYTSIATVPVTTDGLATTLGNLSYFSNSTTGFLLEVTASKMASISNATTSLIGYTVNVGGTALVHAATVLGTERSAPLSLVASGSLVSTLSTKTLTAAINTAEYNAAAAADDYRGTITFYYSAN